MSKLIIILLFKKNLHFAFLILIFTFYACSSSLIYSPAINLSGSQLTAGQVDLKGSIGMLPETVPPYKDSYSCFSAIGEIGYGLSNNFNLYFCGWTDISSYSHFQRGGISLSSRVKLSDEKSINTLIYPRIAILLDGNSINGYGAEIPYIVNITLSKSLYTYFGAGPVYGFKNFDKDINNNNKIPQGFGIIGHIAFGYNFTDNLRLMFELNPLYQIDLYNNRNNYITSGCITFGYTIK